MLSEKEVFAANLNRLMTIRGGMRNATLARKLGVSRQLIANWRRGKLLPAESWRELIARALDCSNDDLTRYDTVTMYAAGIKMPVMVTLSEWARREGITVRRARKMVEAGMIPGSVVGDMCLIPKAQRVPAEASKLFCRSSRPQRSISFSINFTLRMDELRLTNAKVAAAEGVGKNSVGNWRRGRSRPLEFRLPAIAALLRCTVDDLLKPPTQEDFEAWQERFPRRLNPDNDE